MNFAVFQLLLLFPIFIQSQTSKTYKYTWDDKTKTITFAGDANGKGTFMGKFMKATALDGNRMISGKYRQTVGKSPHTIDILFIDKDNSNFIGSFSFQSNVVGQQTVELPNSSQQGAQVAISTQVNASVKNLQELKVLLQNSEIQSNPTPQKGMTLRIFNLSEFSLDVGEATTSQLQKFKPPVNKISMNHYIDLELQYKEGNASQEGTLKISKSTDSSKYFQVKAKVVNGEMKVYLNWNKMTEQKGLILIPPPMTGVTDIQIGLYAGSVYSFGLFDYDKDILIEPVDQSSWKEDWMGTYKFFLNSKKMSDIKIPGTHDAASFSFIEKTLNYQAKTQTQTITAQLNKGIRSFDLRVQKFTGDALTGSLFMATQNQYYMTHGSILVGIPGNPLKSILLTQVFAQFKTFSDTHQNEVIILNFHRMFDSQGNSIFAQQALIDLVTTQLASRMIPNTSSEFTYSKIISTHSHPMRLIVSYNDDTVKNENFWPGVKQIAPNFDSGVFTRTQVFDYIKKQYDENSYTGLSSAQTAMSRFDLGPMSMYYEAQEFCSRLDVYKKLNICHADFTEKGFLVQAMIVMNALGDTEVKKESGVMNGVSLLIIGLISMILMTSSDENF